MSLLSKAPSQLRPPFYVPPTEPNAVQNTTHDAHSEQQRLFGYIIETNIPRQPYRGI